MKKVLAVATVATFAVSGAYAFNTQVCAGCHGTNFEKKAMNVSKVVKEMSHDDIVKALKGYKDGTYGGAMKTIMAGQVKNLSDADIEAIATQIAGANDAASAVKEAATQKVQEEATKAVTNAVVDSAKSQATDMVKGMADKAVDAAADKAKEAATSAATSLLK